MEKTWIYLSRWSRNDEVLPVHLEIAALPLQMAKQFRWIVGEISESMAWHLYH
jgi:hypothetical protein